MLKRLMQTLFLSGLIGLTTVSARAQDQTTGTTDTTPPIPTADRTTTDVADVGDFDWGLLGLLGLIGLWGLAPKNNTRYSERTTAVGAADR